MPPKKRYSEEEDDYEVPEKKINNYKKRAPVKDSTKRREFIKSVIQYVRYNGLDAEISEDDTMALVSFCLTMGLNIFEEDLHILKDSYIELMRINDTNNALRQEDLLYPSHKIIKQNIFREGECGNQEQLNYMYTFYLFVNYWQIKNLAKQLTQQFKNIEVVPEYNTVYVNECNYESDELLNQNIIKIIILSVLHLFGHFNGFGKKISSKIGDESNAKCSKFYNWLE